MWRDSTWQEGFYIDSHEKYECMECGNHFILGGKLIQDCPPGYPICPYCGQPNVESVACTDDEQLEELASEMGCLAIYVEN